MTLTALAELALAERRTVCVRRDSWEPGHHKDLTVDMAKAWMAAKAAKGPFTDEMSGSWARVMRLDQDEYGVFEDDWSEELDPMGAFLRLVGSKTFKFGLRAQGHLPTIERMLAESKSWDEIGRAIGWCPKTAREWWEEERDPPAGDTET